MEAAGMILELKLDRPDWGNRVGGSCRRPPACVFHGAVLGYCSEEEQDTVSFKAHLLCYKW